jgi:hypothetical protein
MSTNMNLTPIDRSVLAACAFGASQKQIIRMLVGPQPEPVPFEMKMAALKSLSALANEKLIVAHDGLWWLAGAAPKSSASSCLSEVEAVRLSKAVAAALGPESLSSFDASLVAQALSHDSLTGDELGFVGVAPDGAEVRAIIGGGGTLSLRQSRFGQLEVAIFGEGKPEPSLQVTLNPGDVERLKAIIDLTMAGPRPRDMDGPWPGTLEEAIHKLGGAIAAAIDNPDVPEELRAEIRSLLNQSSEGYLTDVDFSKQPEPVPAPDDGSEATEELADQFFPTPPDVAALLVRPAPIDPSSLPKVLRESPLELVDVLDSDETALLDLAKSGRSDETVPTPAMDADFEAFLNQPVRARQGLKPDVTFSPQAHDSLDAIQQTAQKPTQITGEITTVFGRSGSAKAAVHIGPAPEPKPLGGHVGPALDPVPLDDAVKPPAKPATKSVREDTLDKLAPDIALLRDQGCDVDVDPPHPDKFFPTFSFRGPGERKTIQITHKDLKQRAARVRREIGA